MSKLLQALQGVEAPKISLKERKGATYNAVAIQPTRYEQTNYAGSVLGLMQAGSQALAKYDDFREKQGKQRSQEMIASLSREELEEARRSGLLAYKDDPYAMRALERELGRQEAYNVDTTIAHQISEGRFNTRAEMEAARAEAMEKSRREMAKVFGMPEEGTQWFNEGYHTDITDRNMSVYGTFMRKENERLSNEMRIVSENNLNDMMNNNIGASDIMTWLKSSQSQGLLASDKEMEAIIQKTLLRSKDRPDGVQFIRDFKEQKIKLFNQEMSVEDYFGKEALRKYELDAAENQFKNNDQLQRDWLHDESFLDAAPLDTGDDVMKARSVIRKWESWAAQSQGGLFTPQAKAIESKVAALATKLEARLAKANAKQQALHEEKARFDLKQDILWERDQAGLLNVLGELDSSNKELGKFTKHDLAEFYNRKLISIRDNPNMTLEAKHLAELQFRARYAGINEDTFSKSFEKDKKDIQRDINYAVLNAEQMIENGQSFEDLELPHLTNALGMLKADPLTYKLVMMDEGNYEQMALLSLMSEDSTIDKLALLKGVNENKRLTPEERLVKSQEFKNAIKNRIKANNVFKNLDGDRMRIAEAMYSYHTSAGASHSESIELVDKWANEQFIKVSGSSVKGSTMIGSIDKRSLLVDGNTDNIPVAKDLVTAYFQSRFPEKSSIVIRSTHSGAVYAEVGTGLRVVLPKDDIANMVREFNKKHSKK